MKLLSKTYSYNVVRKALNLKLKEIKNNDRFQVWLCQSTHSTNMFYRITYNKDFDEINCDCQEFKHKRKCSHSLKAIRIILGQEAFFNNIKDHIQEFKKK